MASPYGLAYGIGAGLAGLPQAYMQGQDQAISRGMRNLQMDEMRRKAELEQATEAALVAPVAPPMRTVQEVAPGMEPSQKAYEMLGEVPGIERPNIPMVEKQKAVPFESRYEQLAFETQQRAQRLRSIGAGSTAMKLEEQAAKYGGMAQEEIGQNAAQSIISGSQDAPDRLRKLGMNVARVTKQGDVFALEDDQGNVTALDYNDLAALAAGRSNLATILQRVGSSENQAKSRELTAKMAQERQGKMIEARRNEILMRGDIQRDLAQYRAANPRAFAGATPAAIKVLEYKIADEMASTKADYITARRAVILREGWEAKRGLTPAQELNSLMQEYKDAAPARKKELLPRIEALRGGSRREATTEPEGVAEPKSKAEYDLLPRGAKYRKDGRIYTKG